MHDWCLVRDDWLNEWSIVPGIRGAWSYRASGLDFGQAPIWASVSSSINRAFVHIHLFIQSQPSLVNVTVLWCVPGILTLIRISAVLKELEGVTGMGGNNRSVKG